MVDAKALHQEAKLRVRDFKKGESRLIEILNEIDKALAFKTLGYTSMHVYCTMALGLSDAQAYSMVGVARACNRVPEIKTLLETEKMTLANATQIMRVITPENKVELLEMAQVLSKRELEREIKKDSPQLVSITIPKELEDSLKRLQDIYSTKKKQPLTLVDTLKAMTDELIHRHDPVEKAQRNLSPATNSPFLPKGRIPLPAQIRHEVNIRDRGQCLMIGHMCGASK